jgi:hypothetical protein
MGSCAFWILLLATGEVWKSRNLQSREEKTKSSKRQPATTDLPQRSWLLSIAVLLSLHLTASAVTSCAGAGKENAPKVVLRLNFSGKWHLTSLTSKSYWSLDSPSLWAQAKPSSAKGSGFTGVCKLGRVLTEQFLLQWSDVISKILVMISTVVRSLSLSINVKLNLDTTASSICKTKPLSGWIARTGSRLQDEQVAIVQWFFSLPVHYIQLRPV